MIIIIIIVIIIRDEYRIVSYRNERYDTIRYTRPTIRYDTIHPIRNDTTRCRHDANTIRYDTLKKRVRYVSVVSFVSYRPSLIKISAFVRLRDHW